MTEDSTVNSIRRVLSLPFRRPSRTRKASDGDSWLKRASSSVHTSTVSSMKSGTKLNTATGTFGALDQTWHDWIEMYQKGTQNLSNIARPVCFNGYGHMSPPESANEAERLQAVARLIDRREIVKQKEWFDSMLRPIMAQHRLSCACISIVDANCQYVCFQIGLGSEIRIISRKLSIDGHALLSKDHFALLDASSDWRTQFNPLVHGPPFLKFYAGVPLISNSNGTAVGVLSMFDPYLRTQVPRGLIQALQFAAEKVMEHIEVNAELPRPRIDWPATSDPRESTTDLESQTDTPLTVDGDSGVPDFCLTHTKPGMASCFQPLGGQVVLQPYQVFESLLKCRSFRQAFVKACHITARTLGLDVVYVVEIRARSRYLVDEQVFTAFKNAHHEDESAAFERLPKRLVKKQIQIRKVGSNSGVYEPELDKKVLLSALSSKFGLKYTANCFQDSEGSAEYPSVLLIPFRRTPATVVNKSNAVNSPSSCTSMTDDEFTFEETKPQPETNVTDNVVYVRWGGFIMCSFSSASCTFSPGDVAFMKKVVKALENILLCQQEKGLADSPALSK